MTLDSVAALSKWGFIRRVTTSGAPNVFDDHTVTPCPVLALLLITDFIKGIVFWFSTAKVLAMPQIPWHKLVQRNAAAMQEASAVIAGVIRWFEERGMYDCADPIRYTAMRDGVQKVKLRLRGALVRSASRRR